MPPVHINSWPSSIRTFEKYQGQTLIKKNLEVKQKREDHLGILRLGNHREYCVIMRKISNSWKDSLCWWSPLGSRDTNLHRNLGSVSPCLLRPSLSAEISLECLSVSITHHLSSLTTICHDSSFDFSFGSSAYKAQSIPRGFAKTIWWQSPSLLQHKYFVELGDTWLIIT